MSLKLKLRLSDACNLWHPRQLKGLSRLWLRDSGIALANWTPVVATGAGAPAVSINATASAPLVIYQIRVRITGNGDETHATFAWDTSPDGGATWAQQGTGTAGAAVALGTTGCVLAFAAGSYTTSHSYATSSNGSGWTDTIAATALAQADNTKRPAVIYDANGYPQVVFDGVNDFSQVAFASAVARPFTIFASVKAVTFANGVYWFDSSAQAACYCYTATGGGNHLVSIGNAIGAAGATYTTRQALGYGASATESWQYVGGVINGTGVGLATDLAGLTVGARGGAGAQAGNISVNAMAVAAANSPASDHVNWRNWLAANNYGVA